MRPRKTLLCGTALLACSLYGAGAQADPVTVQLFYTTFAGGVNVDNVANVTLSGSTLTFGTKTAIATTAGADGILFLPDGNLAIAGQNINNPAQVHEITTGGAAVTSISTTAASNGSYHLALSSNSPTATLYTMCNGGCGANLTRFTLAGGGLSGAGTDITVSGGTSQDVRGIIFDPVNSKWYYGTAGDGSISGTFGTVAFSGTNAALTQLLSGVAAHGLTFDPFTNDIIINSGTEIEQFDPTTDTIVSMVTVAGEQWDQCAADGKGHLFCASNTGDLIGLDYDATALIGTGTHGVAFLASALDDIAPLSGTGAQSTPEPASLALLATGLLGFGLARRRRTECKENRHIC